MEFHLCSFVWRRYNKAQTAENSRKSRHYSRNFPSSSLVSIPYYSFRGKNSRVHVWRDIVVIFLVEEEDKSGIEEAGGECVGLEKLQYNFLIRCFAALLQLCRDPSSLLEFD
ncbi:hypothetical protein NECAME_17700 [Necator americanus]|uniref:Uncharacterized protein n=1 Tax=Necator americanus TaxID=51031 RepID=W2TLG7_NECAM|nr:hypothetical protein NECAME_17700 [Necator americanus]ETN82474.1 hypothetical protein NECAME_17700 [Necator americanus]